MGFLGCRRHRRVIDMAGEINIYNVIPWIAALFGVAIGYKLIGAKGGF